MEWWGHLLYILGIVLGCVLTYYFTRRSLTEDRKLGKKEQTQSAVRDILAEVESNLKLAKEPFRGNLVPFVIDMWNAYKGGIPIDLKEALGELYIKIQQANAIVQDGRKLSHGLGYNDKPYKEKCGVIAEKAEKAKELLVKWLKEEDV